RRAVEHGPLHPLRRLEPPLEAIETVDDEVVQEELGTGADLEGSHRPVRRGRDERCGGSPRAQEGRAGAQEIAAVHDARSAPRAEQGPRLRRASRRRPASTPRGDHGRLASACPPVTMLSEPAADSTALSPPGEGLIPPRTFRPPRQCSPPRRRWPPR